MRGITTSVTTTSILPECWSATAEVLVHVEPEEELAAKHIARAE